MLLLMLFNSSAAADGVVINKEGLKPRVLLVVLIKVSAAANGLINKTPKLNIKISNAAD